jgi:riboflavin synthase
VFTGIVTHTGRVAGAMRGPGGALALVVVPDVPFQGLALGASVAVDGVCLTVVDQADGRLAFDVVPETLRKTTLGSYRTGRRVNLERALRVGDELGGHWVQGHVDGTAELTHVERHGDEVRLRLRLAPDMHGSLLPKGSVTLDGVSLTVGEVEPGAAGGSFSVYLIPHTLAVTTLGERRPGDRLNVEADVLGRWLTAIAARTGR